MTKEEIQEKAETLYAEIAREIGKGGSAVQIPMIANVIRDAAIQAYDEAATSECPHCETGDPLEMGNAGKWYHPQTKFGMEMPCEAWRIRALKDSLTM